MRVCLVKQIYQHVQNQERRDEILGPYNITPEEYADAVGTPIAQSATHVH